MQLAIATFAINGAPFKETDSSLIAPLKQSGIEAEFVVWDDAAADWSGYDAVLVRSIWNYHEKPTQFIKWLELLESASVPMLNPTAMLRWNMNKRYLRELAAHGVPILPTYWPLENESTSLVAILQKYGWQDAVIKPIISASGTDTWSTSVSGAAADQERFDALHQRKALMIQQFAPQIITGEYSLVFFGGRYSHTILKKPGKNALFVQEEHGGSSTLLSTVPDAFIEQAANILHVACNIIGTIPIYARVDVIEDAGTLILMELELIEPELYLLTDEISQRFANAIAADLT